MTWLQWVRAREVKGSKGHQGKTVNRTRQNEHDVSVLREMFPFPHIEPKDSI